MPALGLPAVCDFSITNVCNAACDFCGFARDKTLAGPARYVDAGAFSRALPILQRRGKRCPASAATSTSIWTWNLDIWRCGVWDEPMGSVFDLDRIPDQRGPCNACMMACYRNASMLMHAAVATTDAGRHWHPVKSELP